MLNRRSLLKHLAAIPLLGPLLPKAKAEALTFKGVPLLWNPTLGPPGPPFVSIYIDQWFHYATHLPLKRNWIAIEWKYAEDGDTIDFWSFHQPQNADYVLSSEEARSLIQACISCRSAFGPVMEDSELLCLSRKLNETIQIGNGITVTVLRVEGNKVRLGISAPDHVNIVRGELVEDEDRDGLRKEEGAK